jgi:putative transposase
MRRNSCVYYFASRPGYRRDTPTNPQIKPQNYRPITNTMSGVLVTRMGVISDELWAAVESVMPSDKGKRGNRFGDHRLILEGIAWRFRTGSPWRDLPADFGPWQTVWKRHHRWSLDGTYDKMFTQVAAAFGLDAEMAEDIEKLLSVDSTSVRAHQHCAGARSDTLAIGGTVELQESCR